MPTDEPEDDASPTKRQRSRNLWTILAFGLGVLVFVVPAIVSMAMMAQKVQSAVEDQRKDIAELSKLIAGHETRMQVLERQGDRITEIRDAMADLRRAIEHDRDVQAVREIDLRTQILTRITNVENMFLQQQQRHTK